MGITAKTTKLLIIGLIISALALSASTLAVLTVNKNLGSTGTITTTPNLGVYSDSACTQNVTTINWGTIAAGTNTTQTINIKNTGTGTMTLSMTISNWTPTAASTYITLTWDKQNTQLSAGQSTMATLTLTVSPSTTGITTYSNTITISGSG
jgi:hypothetical protein